MDKEHFKQLWDSNIDAAIEKTVSQDKSKFKVVPVPPKEFFELWMRMPLFPKQYSMVNNVFTKDFKDWDTNINEIMLMYGEGAGKDTLTTRSLCYCLYWMLCLRNPQEYFHSGPGTPIVVLNCSFKEEHASGVFFKQFVTCLRNVKNPATGYNWFEEQGMDLRDGKDVQNRKVIFPNHIEATSESSVRYSAEGKNVLLAVFDEIAEFRYDKAKALYENLKNTSFSRFADHYKIVSISYPRDEYDYFCTIYNEIDNLPPDEKLKVYREKAASWEIRSPEGAHPFLVEKRIYRTQEDYQPLFRKNPEDAMRRFECKFPQNTANRYLKKFELVLDKAIDFDRPSPVIWADINRDKKIYLTEKELLESDWQPWFKPNYSYEAYKIEQELIKNPNDEKLQKRLAKELERHESAQYYIHIDLSRGIKDCAGISIVHSYQLTPTTLGYYVDLAIQIRPDSNEINFDDFRKFVFKLNDLGFEINSCTFDGYQSVYLQQLLMQQNIQSEIISVDRSRKPYDTLKGLMYQGKVNVYEYSVILRELKELRIDEKGKVDHPKESSQRLKEEGIKWGSKDVSDAVAGAIYSAVLQGSDVGPGVVDTIDCGGDFLNGPL